MKKKFTYFQLTIVALLLFSTTTLAQLTGWNYKMPVSSLDTSGVAHTNYQVRLVINSAGLISAGHMQANGDDIRFADSCAATIFPHYIESGINTVNTIIWVMLPSLPANGTASFFMYYGNNTTSNSASFATVFPLAFISGGPNTTLTGTQNYDWFQVDVNDTVFVQAGSVLTINARNVIVNGVISGNGRGHQAPGINTAGTGPGGGGTSTNSGCGGGSYAGVGGTGGLDAGDTPGTGGPAYGTAGGNDIAMGSSGGSGTGTSNNGHGGGALQLNADYITVNGAITMNGANPTSDGTGRGAGGGAGGGIILTGGHVTLAGILACNGGNGASGTSTANDSGGGGAGGRVKAFYIGTMNLSGSMTASFGAGGPYGTAAPGQPGTIGSTSSVLGGGFDVPVVTTGAETAHLFPVLSLSDITICPNDTILGTATLGFTSYVFMVNGNPVFTSTSNTFSFTGLTNGDSLSVIAANSPCFGIPTIGIEITVDVAPVVALGSDTTLCDGAIATLMAPSGSYTYVWSDNSGADSLNASTSGSYSVIVTDIATGCSSSDTVLVTVNPNPIVNLGADTNLCAASQIIDAQNAGASYMWNDMSTSQVLTATSSGSYYVDVTNSFGCSSADTIVLVLNPPPVVTYVASIDTVCQSTTAPFALTGETPAGGLFSGPGVTTGIFDPMTANLGMNIITYQYTDSISGCSSSASDSIFVDVCTDAFALPNTFSGVSLFPNPNDGLFTLTINNEEPCNELAIELISIDGKTVYSNVMKNVSGKVVSTIDVSQLSEGSYLLRVSSSNISETHMLIIQK